MSQFEIPLNKGQCIMQSQVQASVTHEGEGLDDAALTYKEDKITKDDKGKFLVDHSIIEDY